MNGDPDKQVEAYLAGELDAALLADLDRRLHDDPVLRLEMLRSALLEIGLKRLLAGRAAHRRRRFRHWSVLLGLAALLLAQVGGWLWFNRFRGPVEVEPPVLTMADRPETKIIPRLLQGRVVRVQGDAAQIVDGESDQGWQPVVSGVVVRAGARLRAGSDTKVDFCYEDGSCLRLYAHSELMLTETNGAKRILVRAGALGCDVVTQPEERAMEVTASGLTLAVKGTAFLIILEEQSVWTGVRQGRVDVVRASDRQIVALQGGHYVSTHPGWPFMALPTTCPYWQAQCMSKTGTRYR